MNIKDSSLEFLKGFLRCGGVLEGDKVSVRGKAVHNDHYSCVLIGFVERASEVNCQGLVGFVGVREGEGSACHECGGFIVDLALLARPAVDYKVLSHLRPLQEVSCMVVAFVG